MEMLFSNTGLLERRLEMTTQEAIPLMLRSSGLGWATREMGTAFTMGGVSYLPWLAGSLEEHPGEGYWLSFNQRLPISYELGDHLYGLLLPGNYPLQLQGRPTCPRGRSAHTRGRCRS